MRKGRFLLLLVLLVISCTPKDTMNCHYKIKFKNNSDRVLYIETSSDTILYNYSDPRPYATNTLVKAKAGNDNVEIGTAYFQRNGKPMCIEDLYQNEEKIYLFVYDSVALGNKKWEEITRDYLIAKRFDFSLNELRKSDFTVEYSD
ncbi:hypothetical protein [Flavobacterium sp. KACC 22763]|uniref:hypothetical protein n=1 Tax=Flavobacterium sp. KACC 22763 TaxID=3025668 RepID=UPI0023654891|nr:hypothetical protein [Flavobacterium sp. KACC 22763]WDF65354.1 hypothetical protein PQ463_04140 [Flavobacterium sp. KACC 22763]